MWDLHLKGEKIFCGRAVLGEGCSGVSRLERVARRFLIFGSSSARRANGLALLPRMCTIPVSHCKKKIILWIAPKPFAETRFETQGFPASGTPHSGSIAGPRLPSLRGGRGPLPSGSRENPASGAFSLQCAIFRITCPL